MASTCTGNAAPSVVPGAVSLLPATEDGDLQLGGELHRVRVQADASLGGVPRPEFGSSPAVAHSHEQKIAPSDAETLIALRGDEVVDGDAIAGLRP
jgi:hypothetical protein